MCDCLIGGGFAGMCAFHRSEFAKRQQRQYDLEVNKWMFDAILKLAKELKVELPEFPIYGVLK